MREEGRKGRGRREGEELRLYPELQRSQEFHPWKSSFPSFFEKFCKRSPRRSCRSHTRLLSHSRMRRQTGYSAQPSSTPPPLPWASPNSKYNHPWSRLEQTKSAAQGWPGSSLRGSGLARNAWQRTRPNMHRLFLHPTQFFFLSLPFYSPFLHSLLSTRVILPSLPPSDHSCPTV